MIRKHWKKLLTGAVAIIVLAGGALAYALYADANTTLASVTTDEATVADLLSAAPLDGESSGIVNILIAGNSTDDVGHAGAALTDSLMVASYNLSEEKLSLISIPRDLWVEAGGSYMKINAVYTVGGMDLLESTVEQVLGITINHHVLVNYAALTGIVDALGGIDVTIASSDARGIYDPQTDIQLANGVQYLNGQQALALARSRGDPTYDGRVAYGLPNGDFDRAANQQKILLAIVEKASSLSTLTNISTLKNLIESLSGSVTSNLTANQLRRIYDLGQSVNSTASTSIRGEEENLLLADYTSYNGQSALIPTTGISNYEAIQEYVAAFIAPTVQTVASP